MIEGKIKATIVGKPYAMEESAYLWTPPETEHYVLDEALEGIRLLTFSKGL